MRWALCILLSCRPHAGEPAAPGDTAITTPPETGTTTDTEPCAPVEVVSSAAVTDAENVLIARIDVALSAAASLEVRCDGSPQEVPTLFTTVDPAGGEWRYKDDNIAPDPSWIDPGFDDTAWPSGAAPLGYSGDVATEVDPGPEGGRYPTTWFRRTFDYEPVDGANALRLLVRRDDGVVVYLNGLEAARSNMPDGPISQDTLASTTVTGKEEETFYAIEVDRSLADGANTLAVELHQAYADSSDLLLDLAVEVGVDGEPDPKAVDGPHVLTSSTPAASHALALRGLRSETQYACTAAPACGEPYPFSFATGPLPSWMPQIEGDTAPGAAPHGAYTLFNTMRRCAGDEQMHLLIADHAGIVRWYHEVAGIEHVFAIDIELVWLGDVLLYGGGDDEDGTPRTLDLDGDLTYVAAYEGVEDDSYHHDILVKPDGVVAGIVDRDTTDGVTTWGGLGIVEHDPQTQEVVWQYDSQADYDAGRLGDPGGENDPYHANALSYSEDDDGPAYTMGLFYANQILRIDRKTGQIRWVLEPGGAFALRGAEGTPLDTSEWFQGTHAVEVHGDRVFFIDNGTERGKSRARALDVDPTAHTATVAWSWERDGWYDPYWGDIDLLPNGNVLIEMANAQCHGNLEIVEVDWTTGDVVHTLRLTTGESVGYRAVRLEGCDLFSNAATCPELAE